MDLKQVLNDSKTFADGIEIVINNEKVTLGDLRNFSNSRQQEISEKLTAADKRLNDVGELAAAAAGLKEKYEAQIAEAERNGGRGKGTPTDDEFESDPFWAPVRKKYSAADETLKKLNDTVTNLGKAAERMATIWAQDRWKAQYERFSPRLAKSTKHKDMTFERVRDYAGSNKLLDEFGFPSVEKAILELTREEDFETRLAEARESGRQEGVLKGRMASSSRPTSASGPKKPEKSMVGEKGLEGLGDDVASDPELVRMLADLGAADTSEFGTA